MHQVRLAEPVTRRTRRRATGDRAEEAVARNLAGQGWTILDRNVRVGRSEVDIVARDPVDSLVIVEVRSRSVPRFGEPQESVGRQKVARLYAAGSALLRAGRLPDGLQLADASFRVDLVTVISVDGNGWLVSGHLRGLAPP
jgi:putative endonuclease